MSPSESDTQVVQNLEHEADTLLAELAASAQPASQDTLRTLERIAATAARIAYPTGGPGMLSQQMQHLIAWTDHLDDASWSALFQQRLMKRPLTSPHDNAA